MLSPKDIDKLEESTNSLDSITRRIDTSIIINHGKYDFEFAQLDQVLSDEMVKDIIQKYIDSGWKYVYHLTIVDRTRKENKRSIFKFSMKEIKPTDDCNQILCCKEDGSICKCINRICYSKGN